MNRNSQHKPHFVQTVRCRTLRRHEPFLRPSQGHIRFQQVQLRGIAGR